MTLREAIQSYIVDSDPNNGGSITFTADDISPEFAAERLAAMEWADGSDIDAIQEHILCCLADGRDPSDTIEI